MKHLFALFISPLLFTLLFHAACPPLARADEYLIAPADVLDISVWGEQELRRDELVVRPDGKISFPLAGDVDVAGKTTAEVKDLIENALRPYVPQAAVTVIVAQLGSMQFYVLGKVQRPGMYNVGKGLNVLQALSMAGGLTPFAKEKEIVVIRSEGTSTVQFPFNYDQVKEGKKLEQNIPLQRGDVVLVP